MRIFFFLKCVVVYIPVSVCTLHDCTRRMASAHHPANVARPRAILNEAQAIQIFQIKVAANTFMHPRPSSVKIAELFGISEKAVRDIWNGRTWGSVTCHMDPSRPVQVRKDVGRPKGSKDSRPRATQRRLNTGVRFDSKKQTINSIETNIPATCAAKLIASLPSNQVLHVSQQRTVGSDSVDDQLHGWAEGTSTPSELIDPFLFDWVSEIETNTHKM